VPGQVTFVDKSAELLFQGVAAGPGQFDHLARADPAMLARVLENAHGQFRQADKNGLFAFNFRGQPLRLLAQGAQKEQNPGLPVRMVRADRALGLPEREIVAFLAPLDRAFERTVGYVGVPGLEQKQRRQDTAQPSVAVLERMDFEQDHREQRHRE